MPKITQWMGETPANLRLQLQTDTSWEMQLRRGVVAMSLLGITCMAATTLLQTGAIGDLPDPPIKSFNTKKVNSSDEAYSYGGPDSPVAIAAHACNMILAATGTPNRTARQPWLPLLAALVAGAQATVAARNLFHQMPKVDKAWCPYCILEALTLFGTLALTVPEAAKAVPRLGCSMIKALRFS